MFRLSVYVISLLNIFLMWERLVLAQDAPSATPAQIRIASVTPIPEFVAEDTPSFSIIAETSIPSSLILAEALNEANVRSSPEIAEGNQLGQIRQGDRYVVLGQYFNWIQIQYDLSPNQRAWVFRDLVQILGDPDAIPNINIDATPTLEPLILGATQTREALLSQEGGILTVTAQSRILELPSSGNDGAGSSAPSRLIIGADGSIITPKPTFTYPPGFDVAAVSTEVLGLEVIRTQVALVEIPVEESRAAPLEIAGIATTSDVFSPLLLMVLFGGLGLIGLLVSVLRG